MRRFAMSQIYNMLLRTGAGMKELEVTHADLPILGASGKIFSIGTEAHAADVQVTIFVCFVIDEYANLMLV
jgi:hypothetical protein